MNKTTFDLIQEFILNASYYSSILNGNGQIPTAVISSESCPKDHDVLMQDLFQCLDGCDIPKCLFVRFDASSCQYDSSTAIYELFQGHMTSDSDEYDRLVLFIDNAEVLDPAVFESFICRLKHDCLHGSSAKTVSLLLGTSLPPESLQHNVLSSQLVVNSIQVCIFRDLDSKTALLALLQEMTIELHDDFPVCPGNILLEHLVHHFRTSNSSLHSASQMIKFAYMDFFFSNPLSHLLFLSHEEFEELTVAHLEQARSLNSFHNFVDREMNHGKLLKPNAGKLLTDHRYFALFLEESMDKFTAHRTCRRVVYEILSSINTCLKLKSSFRLDPLDLIVNLFSPEFTSSLKFDGLMKAIKFFTVDAFQEFVEVLHEKLSDLNGRYPENFESFSDFHSLLQILEDCMKSELFTNDDKNAVSKETIQQIRLEVQNRIYGFLNLYHNPYLDLSFFECAFLSNTQKIKKVFSAQPRAAIHTALAFPYHYYGTNNAEAEDLSKFDDVSIAYHIYMESGQLINLFDWFMSFAAIVNPSLLDDDDDESDGESIPTDKKRNEGEEKIALTRFIRAVTELCYCGFIKTTTRKTDHVERLTTGI